MNKIASAFHQYNWFIKLIGAGLLITLAIVLWVMDLERMMEAFVGVLIATYAIVRLVPFVRSQKSDLIKTINIIEITLNVLIAAIFIVAAFATEEGLGMLFGYLVAGVLIARGMVHFYGLSEGAEKGDHLTYFFHIATLVIGTLIIARGFDVSDLIILIVILSFLSGGYLVYDGYKGYSMYRRRKQLEEGKQPEKGKEERDIEMPGKKDEERERDRIVS